MKLVLHAFTAAALGHFAAALAIGGVALPEGLDEEKLLRAAKAAAPPALHVRFVTLKTAATTENAGDAQGTLTINLMEDLYADVSAELLGPETEGVPRPTVLRKTHRHREILELPVHFTLAKLSDSWTVAGLTTQPSLQALGAPLRDFPGGAAVLGSTQGDAAIRAYQAALKKAAPAKSASASPRLTPEERAAKDREAAKEREQARRAAAEKKAQEAEQAAEEKREAARAEAQRDLEALQAACALLRRYAGTITDRTGAHEVDLVFTRFEREGDFVSAELLDRNSAMRRKFLSGSIRANKLLATHYELVLVGVTDGATGSALGRSSQKKAAGTQTTLILTSDREGNLVGKHHAQAVVSDQSSTSFRPTPLSNHETFPVRFRPVP